jgi:two-component system, response regulator
MLSREEILNSLNIEILLIEDSYEDARVVIETLRKNNINNKLLHIADGEVALEFLAAQSLLTGKLKNRLKLILLNLKMPGFDEMHILKAIRRNPKLKSIPVIIISSLAPAASVLESYQLGISSFVVKPTDAREYEDEISHLEVQKLLYNTVY